jgi:hypothetical protein
LLLFPQLADEGVSTHSRKAIFSQFLSESVWTWLSFDRPTLIRVWRDNERRPRFRRVFDARLNLVELSLKDNLSCVQAADSQIDSIKLPSN